MCILRSLALVTLVLLAGCRGEEPGQQADPLDLHADLQLNTPKQIDLGSLGVHTFTALQATASRVLLEIRSEPRVWTFTPGTPQPVDLNGEGGPEIVVTVTSVEGGGLQLHIQDVSTAGERSNQPVKPLEWDTPVAAEPPGTVIYRLTLVADVEPTPYLYDVTPLKSTCDVADPRFYDDYVAETGGKTRISHQVGSSRGFPHFSILTEEPRTRWSECAPNQGHAQITDTELTLDSRQGIDLNGDGTYDVDAVLHQVEWSSSHQPTLHVLIYAR